MLGLEPRIYIQFRFDTFIDHVYVRFTLFTFFFLHYLYPFSRFATFFLSSTLSSHGHTHTQYKERDKHTFWIVISRFLYFRFEKFGTGQAQFVLTCIACKFVGNDGGELFRWDCVRVFFLLSFSFVVFFRFSADRTIFYIASLSLDFWLFFINSLVSFFS